MTLNQTGEEFLAKEQRPRLSAREPPVRVPRTIGCTAVHPLFYHGRVWHTHSTTLGSSEGHDPSAVPEYPEGHTCFAQLKGTNLFLNASPAFFSPYGQRRSTTKGTGTGQILPHISSF